MNKTVNRLTSKIVQVEEKYVQGGHLAWMLCEDGSVWICNDGKNEYRQVHPPHEPPAQAADLAEALKALRYLFNSFEPVCETGWDAYRDAEKLLEKHGA